MDKNKRGQDGHQFHQELEREKAHTNAEEVKKAQVKEKMHEQHHNKED